MGLQFAAARQVVQKNILRMEILTSTRFETMRTGNLYKVKKDDLVGRVQKTAVQWTACRSQKRRNGFALRRFVRLPPPGCRLHRADILNVRRVDGDQV